jgi:protein-S-isoprenylcysteine O-methyltransferase Ste14
MRGKRKDAKWRTLRNAQTSWAFVPALIAVILLLIRAALEDRMLHAELTGYTEYAARVRFRLIPGVW